MESTELYRGWMLLDFMQVLTFMRVPTVRQQQNSHTRAVNLNIMRYRQIAFIVQL